MEKSKKYVALPCCHCTFLSDGIIMKISVGAAPIIRAGAVFIVRRRKRATTDRKTSKGKGEKMKRIRKRVLAMLLCLIMALPMCSSAFAADSKTEQYAKKAAAAGIKK